MNKISKQLSIYSLSSLAIIGASAAYADQDVRVPTFDGGLTASIGTFYAIPSTASSTTFLEIDDTTNPVVEVVTLDNVSGEYDWGFEASLGYIFEDTANGIELSYRGIDTDNSVSELITPSSVLSTVKSVEYTDSLGFELNNVDLMLSQYIDVGQQMQLRLSAGASYVDLEQTQTLDTLLTFINPKPGTPGTGESQFTQESEFSGFGPRLGMDARYDFGQGFGIVGGASVAYFLGEIDFTANAFSSATRTGGGGGGLSKELPLVEEISEDFDNQAVTNLRGNVGIDYVYFFDNEGLSTIGLELGYMVDYYADAAVNLNNTQRSINGGVPQKTQVGFANNVPNDPSSITFSGPYLNLKGAF